MAQVLRLVPTPPRPDLPPRSWPREKQLRQLLAAHAQLAQLALRRPDLAPHLRLPLDQLWSEVPAPVREKVRAVVRRTAPRALVLMPAGGATLGQDTSVEDLRTAVRDWADHLGRVRATAEGLWRAARVMNTATTAAARAAAENPDAALSEAGRRLRDAASITGLGLGVAVVAAVILLALWKR